MLECMYMYVCTYIFLKMRVIVSRRFNCFHCISIHLMFYIIMISC